MMFVLITTIERQRCMDCSSAQDVVMVILLMRLLIQMMFLLLLVAMSSVLLYLVISRTTVPLRISRNESPSPHASISFVRSHIEMPLLASLKL